VYIANDLRLARLRGGPANTLAKRNANARWFPLERADDEFGAIEEIKAAPVQVRQRVINQRGKIRRIGNAIGFIAQESAGLCKDFLILLRFGTGRVLDCE
jgi:hypothetical protein